MTPSRILAAILAAFSLVSPVSAQTTTYTWSGNAASIEGNFGSADASKSGNWVGGSVPSPSLTQTVVSFGASAGIDSGEVMSVYFQEDFDLFGALFNAPLPIYQIGVNGEAGYLGLGAGGLTMNGDAKSAVFLHPTLQLNANQPWAISEGAVYTYGRIIESGGSHGITKTGSGYLVLDSDSSTFSGGVDVQNGTLFLGGSSGRDGEAIFSGPVGTGTLTLRDNTTLRSNSFDRITLHNPVRLGTNVTFGSESEDRSIDLVGNITLLNASTTILLGSRSATFFEGGISDATIEGQTAPSSVRFRSTAESNELGVAVLSGTNTYTGGTIADHSAVIFYAPGSIPTTGAIAAVNSGYVSTGYNGGMTTILSRIASPTDFNGSLGFDTDPENSDGPGLFNDDINLSAFNPDGSDPLGGFWGLGTQTSAVINGVITPPNGGNFVFGGGSGKLYVQSDLGATAPVGTTPSANATTAAVGVRVRSTYGSDPLTVWLRGNNSYNGNLMSDHSIVVLDSANALPAGSLFSMDSQSYVGYTESAGFTPAQFIARLQSPAYSSDSVLGFDSMYPEGRSITDAIDLSALGNIYVGSTTHAHLTGPIRAPASGKLSVAGIDSGWISIDSALTPTVTIGEGSPVSGVTSLQVGMSAGVDTFRRGIVELTSPNSTFAGGTSFRSGYLLLGASSTGSAGAPTSGPLGTGTLTFQGFTSMTPTVLVAGTTNVTLHNNINFMNGAMAQFGVDTFQRQFDDRDPGSQLEIYQFNGFTLAGNLSGSAAQVLFTGGGTHTISGNNSGFAAGEIAVGRASFNDFTGVDSASLSENLGYGISYTTPLLVVASNNALGSTHSLLRLSNGADLRFTTTAPAIGSITGGDTINYDGPSDRSYISLAPSSTLTINQNQDGELGASIGGNVSDRDDPESYLSPIAATVVKTGSGTLTLSGQSTFSGLSIQGGAVIAAVDATIGAENNTVSGPLGTGTVTLAGGRLGVANGAHFVNPIVFSGTGNTLSGNGTFHTAITIGSGTTLAPGNSPGALDFANGLTWGPGGVFSLDIADMSLNPGVGYDLVVMSGGTFALTATAQNPFTLQLNSLTALDGEIGLLGATPTQAYSLAIFQSSTSLTGLWGTNGNSFDNIALNTANFTSSQPGNFSLSLANSDTTLMLNFTPTTVPEPSTYAMIGLGLVGVAYTLRRQRRSRR